MILALALAALNQDKRLRPSPMFRAQENPPTKTVGYRINLTVGTRQHQGMFRGISGRDVASTEEVFELAPGGKVPGASRTAAAAGAERQPSTTIHGGEA